MKKQQFAVVSIDRYIKTKFAGSKAEFARSQGVLPQQITKWINGGWFIGGGLILSPKREVILHAEES
jgi:hypothetical protein